MGRSSRPGVMDFRCLRQFRRRRLLAFLRRDNLPATFDALKQEAPVLLDVRFLQRLVVDGRWQEARQYINRFLPRRDDQMFADAPIALRFIAYLNVLDDLAHGNLGGNDAIDDLERQIEAVPSTMADSHYTEAIRVVFNARSLGRSHPAYWDPVDRQLIRLKASQIVKDLIMQIPKFKHLLQLPRCPVDPCYTIPFGFWGHRRHKKKNMRQMSAHMSASLLARRFLPKERRPPSPWSQGSYSDPMDLDDLIDETLLAGMLDVSEHSGSSGEVIAGAPVVSCTGKNCGESSARAATKRLNEEDCYAESAGGAKHPHATGEFHPGVVDTPSSGVDPMRVLKKLNKMQEISSAMTSVLLKICAHGPDRRMFIERMLDLDKVIYELRVDSIEATLKDCTSSGTIAAPESSASFSCI